MRVLIQKYKKKQRKAGHIRYLENRIVFLHNEIVNASFKGEYSFNKNITVIHGNLENKAKLLKKYNRRLKILIY
jgi:hypothetical protein